MVQACTSMAIIVHTCAGELKISAGCVWLKATPVGQEEEGIVMSVPATCFSPSLGRVSTSSSRQHYDFQLWNSFC